MTSTQLRMVPYKREELRRLLRETVTESSRSKVNATTKRLVQRNLEAPWSKELGAIDMVDLPDSPLSPTIAISYVASPHSSSSGLPSTSFDHHTTVKSEPTVRKNAEAAAALEELKLTYPSTRCHRHFTDDDFSRRGSTVSTNSLASQQSVAVASTVVGPNGSAVDSDDLSSPIGSNIARPSSTGSTASSISNKRKPPPIPPLKKTQQQQLHSLQPLTLDVDADSSNGMFRRRLKSEATGSKPKRAPPPIPFDKKKHIRQQEARVESPAR